MSREQWANVSRSVHNGYDISAFKHEPLGPRTNDPEALDLDEAYELFFNGVKLARAGDLAAGCAQIACAFLLDDRSINFVPDLPPGTPGDITLHVIDLQTLYKMISLDLNGFGSRVLRILLGIKLGSIPGDGQTMIAEAFRCIESLLSIIEMQPEVEDYNRGILGGCCTRKRLLYIRSTLHMSMGNQKNALKDLTKALKIDPNYTTARDARVCVWAGTNLKDNTTIHREYETIVSEYHPDNRGLNVAYAWLAITTFKDPKLGTYEKAKSYYEKSLKASSRYDAIYGKRKKEEEPPVLEQLKVQFASLHANPRALKSRKDLDSVQVEIQGDPTSKLKHSCLKCGNREKKDGGGKLMKCARCKSVSYCSRECQREDWKEHKVYCKIAAQPKEKISNQGCSIVTGGLKNLSFNGPTKEDLTPKEPVDEIQARSQATWRLLTTLKELDSKFGKNFATWWHKMNIKERKAILLKVTNDTLNQKEPSESQIKRELTHNGSQGCVLFDYNIEHLVGRCKCSVATCPHHHNDAILHEIHDWVHNTEEREDTQHQQIMDMVEKGIFPSQFGRQFAIMVPEEGKWEMSAPMVFTSDCPQHELDEYKNYVAEGKIYDASIGLYTISQRYLALGLLVKLYDEYQQKVRRMPSTYPFEAILGCRHCNRSCDGESALRCKRCEVSWFCCHGCMRAAGHETCPIGVCSYSAVMFKF